MARRMTRRTVLQGMAAGAGMALAGGLRGPAVWAAPGVLAPGSRPDPTKPEGTDTLPQVEHIVIYMQENHSYDSYFGMLEVGDGFTLDGSGNPTNACPNPLDGGAMVTSFRAAEGCQLGAGVSQSWNATHKEHHGGAMDGFLYDGNANAMKYWDESFLPFYFDLARTFVLCDRWFASTPCQTYPNRRYLQAATSAGLVSTSASAVLAAPDAPNGTIWDRLNDHGITWADYAFDLPDLLLFPNVEAANRGRVKTIGNFLADCAAGTLPQVSIVSPGFERYTEENPHDVQLGEAYSARIVNAVLESPAWGRTVMFFTYDEHGGYYDHVAPPPAVAPDAIPPNIEPGVDEPGGFDMYGFRVPGFVISPFAKASTVSSTVYDHTSILKFIETKFNLGALTYRDANANDLLDALDFDAPAFPEPPTLAEPGLGDGVSACEPGVANPKTIVATADVPVGPTEPTTTTTAATTTTTAETTTTGPAEATAAAEGELVRTGAPDMTGATVVGVSAVAVGLAALAARSRLLGQQATDHAATAAASDGPPSDA